jgi:hypothetical protein
MSTDKIETGEGSRAVAVTNSNLAPTLWLCVPADKLQCCGILNAGKDAMHATAHPGGNPAYAATTALSHPLRVFQATS